MAGEEEGKRVDITHLLLLGLLLDIMERIATMIRGPYLQDTMIEVHSEMRFS